MIHEEKLDKLYERVINDQALTTKELKKDGFNSRDLSGLIEEGILERIKRGYYSFLSIEKLFYYGKKLIALKEYDKAKACFEKCYELNPNHLGSCFQLFLCKIKNKEYSKAFEYFDQFYNTDNPFYKADSNFYLYLLNMITEVPEKYRQRAKFLTFQDIKVSYKDLRYQNVKDQNRLRTSIMNQKLALAVKQISNIIQDEKRTSLQNYVAQILISQALDKKREDQLQIWHLEKEKCYDEVIDYLNSLREKHHLGIKDNIILLLTKELKNLQTNDYVPKKKIFQSTDLLEAIHGRNYELAFSLCSNFIQKKGFKKENDILYLLLSEINAIVRKKEIEYKKKQGPIDLVKSEEGTMEKMDMVSNIVQYLKMQDFDNAFKTLRNCLDSENKNQYEFLILDLIKISLLENDLSFSRPMITLSHILDGTFEFPISEYIQDYFRTAAQDEFNQTRIYLDIISKSNLFDSTYIIKNNLEELLNYLCKDAVDSKNLSSIKQVDRSKEKIDQENRIHSSNKKLEKKKLLSN